MRNGEERLETRGTSKNRERWQGRHGERKENKKESKETGMM